MPLTDLPDLKKRLREAGFEVYRSTPEKVLLAERVRDNLIMDSGVAAQLGGDDRGLAVQVTVRAQASHFPGTSADGVWNHARRLATPFLDAGYAEEDEITTPVPDPSDPAVSLDTAHEIRMRRDVDGVDSLLDELREALLRQRSTADD